MDNQEIKLDNSDNSDNSSDYLNLEELIQEQMKGIEIKNIYQIQITNEKLLISHISKNQISPDIIIQENFGPESQYSLYSCVYIQDELEKNNDSIYYPLVKLVELYKKNELNQEKIITYSIAVKFNNQFNLESNVNKELDDFKIFIVANEKNKENIYTNEIPKDITQLNILEKLIEYVMG
jgi:hypothetical protein